MPRHNIFAPYTGSTTATTGIPSASTSGTWHGASHAGRASSNVMQESNLSERDSLLKALQILFKEPADLKPDEIAGLNLFPEALKKVMLPSANGMASIASKLSMSPITASSHVSQLSLDITVAMQGILQSVDDSKPFLRTKDASTLDRAKELQDKKNDFSAHCKALCHHSNEIFNKLYEVIKAQIDGADGFAKSHKSLAQSSAVATVTQTLGTSALFSFMADLIGSTFRESSALIDFSRLESRAPQENNIYQAFSACCQSFSDSRNARESFVKLRHLEQVLSDFNQASDICEQHAATSPAMSVFIRLLTTSPFLSTLRLVNTSAIALSAFHQVMSQDQDKLLQSARDSFTKASVIKDSSGGEAKHHSANVTQFCNHFDEVLKLIDEALKDIASQSDQFAVKSSAHSTAALITIPSLVTGFTGLISRELSGSIDFITHDKGTYQQSAIVLQSRADLSGKDLDELMTRIFALQERIARCEALGVSAPVSLGMSHIVTSGGLSATLNTLVGTCFALREIHTLSKSPVVALKLDEAELEKAKQYAEASVASNKNTAGTLGSAPASENLSLHQHLESVMQKIVLTHRSGSKIVHGRDDLNSAGKSTIVSSLHHSTGFLLGALGTLALVSLQSGISFETLFNLMQHSLPESQRASDGVDKTKTANSSQFNISSLSNLTRLSAEKSGHVSLSQSLSASTHHVAEVASSRALTVALCHSGAMRVILQRLSREAQVAPIQGFSHLSVVSAAISDQLPENILKVLDEAEQNQNPIPGLNQDMASQLGFTSHASIASALCTHSTLIASFLQSSAAIKNIPQTEDKVLEEAIPEHSLTSNTISRATNAIQAFTHQCIEAFKELQALELQKNQEKPMPSSMHTHFKSNTASAFSFMASCAVSLLCEELLEITASRPLSLLDRNKVTHTMKQSTAQSRLHGELSGAIESEASHSGDTQSSTYSLAELRLTLSHLGVSLANFANALQQQLSEANHDLLQENLELHTSQRQLVQSMAFSLSQSSLVMTQLSAFLSRSSLTALGTIDESQKTLHSLDHTLMQQRLESSAPLLENMGSESLIMTGIGIDSLSNALVSAIKLLLKSSISGLDTALSTAKILEIISLNPEPYEALMLESEALSQPNRTYKNISELSQNSSVGASMVTASVSNDSRTSDKISACTEDSIHSLQLAVDKHIEQCAMLSDDEEAPALGLKKFYEILIRLLAQHEGLQGNERDHRDLVQRFDRGGIALSHYHSAYGGIPGNPQPANATNPLIVKGHFLRCENAASLLETFINKAYLEEANPAVGLVSLLDQLKNELRAPAVMSLKTKERWDYIVKKISDKLIVTDLRHGILHPAQSLSRRPNRALRRDDLLHNWDALLVSSVEGPPAEDAAPLDVASIIVEEIVTHALA